MKKMEVEWLCFWKLVFVQGANFHIKGIMLQTLRGKQKYKVTNVGVEEIKLSRLLAQPINEFKIKEIQRKTSQ